MGCKTEAMDSASLSPVGMVTEDRVPALTSCTVSPHAEVRKGHRVTGPDVLVTEGGRRKEFGGWSSGVGVLKERPGRERGCGALHRNEKVVPSGPIGDQQPPGDRQHPAPRGSAERLAKP